MILLPANSNQVMAVGLTKCKIADPQKALERLRTKWPGLELQLVRADRIAGSEHLKFAARNAVHAFQSTRKRSRTLAVELLIYLSCTRQISKAIETMGVTSNTSDIGFVAYVDDRYPAEEIVKSVAKVTGGLADDTVFDLSRGKVSELKKTYGITKKELDATRWHSESEIEALKRIVVERSALVTVAG